MYVLAFKGVSACCILLNKYLMNPTECSVWVFVHELGAFHALSNPVFLGISLAFSSAQVVTAWTSFMCLPTAEALCSSMRERGN